MLGQCKAHGPPILRRTSAVAVQYAALLHPTPPLLRVGSGNLARRRGVPLQSVGRGRTTARPERRPQMHLVGAPYFAAAFGHRLVPVGPMPASCRTTSPSLAQP